MGDNRDGAHRRDLVSTCRRHCCSRCRRWILADLVGEGIVFEVASGGRGGLGNADLASRAQGARSALFRRGRQDAIWCWSSNRSPTSVSAGFPSAGKSRWSKRLAASLKIADYLFTNFVPNPGVVQAVMTSFPIPG